MALVVLTLLAIKFLCWAIGSY